MNITYLKMIKKSITLKILMCVIDVEELISSPYLKCALDYKISRNISYLNIKNS